MNIIAKSDVDLNDYLISEKYNDGLIYGHSRFTGNTWITFSTQSTIVSVVPSTVGVFVLYKLRFFIGSLGGLRELRHDVVDVGVGALGARRGAPRRARRSLGGRAPAGPQRGGAQGRQHALPLQVAQPRDG